MTHAIYNALLIRYEGGHAYLDRADGHVRREAYLELGGVIDRDVALAYGLEYVRQWAGPRYSDAIEGTVLAADQVPTVGYNLGDLVGGKRLRAYTASLTGEGVTSIVPELDEPFDIADAALARRIARAGAGLVSEYARPNVNRQETGEGTDSAPPEFSIDGPVVSTLSPAWTAARPWWGAWLDVNIELPGASPTRVVVARNAGGLWRAVADCTVGTGNNRGLGRINAGWAIGERLAIIVPTPGLGAQKLTATLRGVMV